MAPKRAVDASKEPTVQVRIRVGTHDRLDRYVNSFKRSERPRIQDLATEAVELYLNAKKAPK